MPKQEHIDEIAGYIKSFENGTRRHHQEFLHSHCGTAHCLAGWKELDDAVARGDEVFWRDGEGSKVFIEGVRHPHSNGWDYAAAAWELNEDDDEDYILFDPDLTLEEMKANLRAIAAHHNLTCPI